MLCLLLFKYVSHLTALLSTQADDRVRVEKRDCAQFEFASAMNTVTEFYCHSQEQGVFIFLLNLLYSVQIPIVNRTSV